MRTLLFASLLCLVANSYSYADDQPWLKIEPGTGPGNGKHIVFISGDEEYRSEEALPQLAKILAKHHGFRCTVLFAIDPKTGTMSYGWEIMTPPFDWDLGDAGKKASDGWMFWKIGRAHV